MNHDDELLDSIAVFALGALPESQARDVAAHIESCSDCLKAYSEFRATANLVGYAAEIDANDLGELAAKRMKSAVMRQLPELSNGAAAARLAAGASPSAPSVAKRPAASWLAYGVAAAAIVVALLSTSKEATLRSDHERDTQRIAALAARTRAQAALIGDTDSRLAALFAPDSKQFAVRYGKVITSGGRVYLALRRLAPLAPGKVYQAWTVPGRFKPVAPSVTFVPRESGVTIVELPERSAGLVAIAVTVEPAGGSKKPTSKPTFIRPLS